MLGDGPRDASPQRHLNPHMQLCPVPTRCNPSKSVHFEPTIAIKFFDFKGLQSKLLNGKD